MKLLLLFSATIAAVCANQPFISDAYSNVRYQPYNFWERFERYAVHPQMLAKLEDASGKQDELEMDISNKNDTLKKQNATHLEQVKKPLPNWELLEPEVMSSAQLKDDVNREHIELMDATTEMYAETLHDGKMLVTHEDVEAETTSIPIYTTKDILEENKVNIHVNDTKNMMNNTINDKYLIMSEKSMNKTNSDEPKTTTPYTPESVTDMNSEENEETFARLQQDVEVISTTEKEVEVTTPKDIGLIGIVFNQVKNFLVPERQVLNATETSEPEPTATAINETFTETFDEREVNSTSEKEKFIIVAPSSSLPANSKDLMSLESEAEDLEEAGSGDDSVEVTTQHSPKHLASKEEEVEKNENSEQNESQSPGHLSKEGVYYLYHPSGLLQRIVYRTQSDLENMEYVAHYTYKDVEPITGPIYTYNPNSYVLKPIQFYK